MRLPLRSGPALEAVNIAVAYGRAQALADVSFELRAGELTAIVGSNGSGKSTLVNVLAGTQRPDSGFVRCADRLRVGLVVQRSVVPDQLPLTVRDVVTIGRWGRGSDRRDKFRDRAVVDRCLDRLGIAPLAESPLHALSGGQRQRALVAQGLAREADLLLLDEPTAALDHTSRVRVREAVQAEMARGATVVLVTHLLEEVRSASQVITLEHGRIVAE